MIGALLVYKSRPVEDFGIIIDTEKFNDDLFYVVLWTRDNSTGILSEEDIYERLRKGMMDAVFCSPA
jgi:hypothetical protein